MFSFIRSQHVTLSLSLSLLLPAVNLPSGGIAAVAEPRVAETSMDKRTTTHGSLLILGRARVKEVGREFGE